MKKLTYLILPLLLIFSYGCDSNVMEPVADDSSYAADMEAAKMALDDGNYDKSIRLAGNHYNPDSPDPEAGHILSSAYMGKAGVDLTYIIEYSDNENQEGYDVIATALAHKTTSNMTPQIISAAAGFELEKIQIDEPRFIDQNSIADMLNAMDEAKTILQDLADYFSENNLSPENDDIVKLGMASALDFIMKVSEAVSEITGTNAPINKEAYDLVFSATDANSLLNDLQSYLTLNPGITGVLTDDLINVKNAIFIMIDLIGADEDITQDFDQFIREILGLDNFTPVTDNVIREHLTAARIVEFVGTELVD